MQSIIRWFYRLFHSETVQTLTADIRKSKYRRGMFKSFDWFLYILVICISLYGCVAIFSATSSATDYEVKGLRDILSTHSVTYARLQFIWILAGSLLMFFVCIWDYHLFGKYSQFIYLLNIAVLLITFTVERGRGGMTAFFNVNTNNTTLGQRSIQPSEFGKVAMIIALAKLFSQRKTPIRNIRELLPSLLYVGVPGILVLLQPDFGTALVYFVMYIVLLFISGTDKKLIWGLIAVVIAIAIPLWFWLNAASDNFRLTRILMWFNPDQYPDEARQVINGQIAVGSGGLTGKGVVSIGSFASLGFIPDDHTDFCFAILCEAFGFIGALVLVIAFMVFLGRLLHHALKAQDLFGEYLVICAFSMYMFHILENMCMILGILPVTGIPLPFISYGGSNLLTNMITLGVVMSVVMRTHLKSAAGQTHYTKKL